MVLRERSYDYQFRYCGHCNTTTDIKEANFFGRSEALDRRRVHIIIGSRSWWGGATREATLWPLTAWLRLCPLGYLCWPLFLDLFSEASWEP